MFLVGAAERREALIVGKFERHLLARRRTLRNTRPQGITIARGHSAEISSPLKLFDKTSTIRTFSIAPTKAAAFSTWTACNQGLRPTACPGLDPCFSKSTATVRSLYDWLNATC